MISLDDVVLRDDLDPRQGERDDGLIAQYADIFDALPPIEVNQDYELIDGWHRVRAAEWAKRTEIAYVVVETDGDDDLTDKMWAANLRHGVQYTRDQRQTHGMKLHDRGLKAKEIAERIGVGASSVYRWTKEHRERMKQERDSEIQRLRGDGLTQQEIADELGIAQSTVAEIIGDSQMRISDNEPESEAEPAIAAVEEETVENEEAAEECVVEEQSDEPELALEPPTAETETDEAPADKQPDNPHPEPEAADEELATSEPEPEPPPPEDIPDHILDTARAVMGAFAETRPDDYVARLETSPSEWMTITDDSLSNELERELLTSAAAMCLWQEWMIWYRGGSTSAFTDAFGKIGPVFVRGQAGQWTIVTRLRSILRRLWK